MSDHGRGEHSGHDLFDAPPDSGEREVRLRMALAALGDIAEPRAGMAEADARTRAHWAQSAARLALIKLSDPGPPDFSLIRNDLAQRILAALERAARRLSIAKDASALADELRKEMGK